jgi:hypothetical protein
MTSEETMARPAAERSLPRDAYLSEAHYDRERHRRVHDRSADLAGKAPADPLYDLKCQLSVASYNRALQA